ncbi:MAG TPA: sterol desaturase family protein [Polyangium sp.]|nr:sterol desaturase family protein [Polyangium sp.]
MMDGSDEQEVRPERRAQMVAHMPTRYSPTLHLAIPALIGFAVLMTAIVRLQTNVLRPAELLTIPVTLLLGFGFEWRAHKDILHRRLPLLGILYERHELYHHVIFTDRDMAMRSKREWWFVLMPPYAVVLVFLTLVLPMAIVIEKYVSTNVAMLVTATSMVFFLSYEWLHLAYHLPADHPISQWRVIAKLREHHRRHHDPRLMKRWNFNVTVPLFDLLHGTTWSPEREEKFRAARALRRGAEKRAT